MTLGCAGHGVSTTARTSRPAARAADALGDDHVGAQAAHVGHERRRVERRAGQLGRQVRRDGRPEAMRRDLVHRARRRRREQLVVGGAVAVGLVEAGDGRLEGGHVEAVGAQRRDQRGGEHGLADARVGAGDEEAAQARARLRGLALDVEGSVGRPRGGLARGRHRHALARAPAGLQRRAPQHLRGLAQLRPGVRGHHGQAQP